MILACLFSTLDNVVTLSNAHGTIAVQTWPRLFLAASGLAAGLIFDLAERRYMGLVMLGIADHALTPREVDVLIAVTQDERPLKQVAEELGISMRMVQRHLSSIYQKTDTQTRAGLAKAFPSA